MTSGGSETASFESLPLGCAVTIPSLGRSVHYGLYSANESFVHALIRYSSFKIIHLFVPGSERERINAELKPAIESAGREVHVAVVPVWHIGECLAKFDYAALHWGDPFIDTLAEIRNRFSSAAVPITGVTHSLAFDFKLNSFRGLFSGQVRPYDAVICTSPQAREALRRIGQLVSSNPEGEYNTESPYDCQLVTIPLGTAEDNAPPIPRDEARLRLGLDNEDTVILIMGRISLLAKMDLHPALLALEELVNARGLRKVKMIFAGSSDKFDNFLSIIMNRVKSLGLTRHVLVRAHFPESERSLLIDACDVFLSLPDNLQESFGLAPVEVMLRGKPCVLSDWDGYRELVEDGVSGYLIPTCGGNFDDFLPYRTLLDVAFLRDLYLSQAVATDMTLLVDRLAALASNAELRAQLGTAGQARARELFTWKRIIPRYEALWKSLKDQAGQKPPPPKPPPSSLMPFRCFSHYPTRCLEAGFQVRASARGIRVLNGQETPAFYRELNEILRAPLIKVILERSQESADVSALELIFPSSREFLHFHILWMLKHDLLRAV